VARFAARRAAAAGFHSPWRAEAWLRLACALSPTFAPCFEQLVQLRRARENRWGAVATAQVATRRFPSVANAWMLLGEAQMMVFRQADALSAFEQAMTIEERADAALAAGEIYFRQHRYAEASARFARAYAAGAGPDALRRNAQSLHLAGDEAAAEAALRLWSEQIPGGATRLEQARAELRSERRG
jgi:tetratricopeptide (TPR) repeat protein